LAATDWDLEAAIANYYAAQEDHAEDNQDDSDYMDEDDPESSQEPQTQSTHPAAGAGRRLGDGPSDSQPIPTAPTSSSSSSQPKPQPGTQKKFATIGDVSASGANGDDSDDDDDKHDLFAGGEKSGLAVQNPDDLRKRILEKAQKRGPPPKDAAPKKSHFTGAARTLGGDEEPSREIPSAPQPRSRAERVERMLHFWQDGFSIDDGDLYRFDDPTNSDILNSIRQGRAPLNIMNVQPGQEVDVEIKQHEEKYVKPKMKYKPFGGSGQRLGSPTPGVPSMPGAFTSESAAPAPAPVSTTAAPPTAEVDESKPTITLRISLGSGTRLTSRFNTGQTIGDVYDFVRRAEPGGREFVLQTTFPTTDLTDQTKVLGEMTDFKRGGAVVQRYV
jgi:UBX domain-containing protein 1